MPKIPDNQIEMVIYDCAGMIGKIIAVLGMTRDQFMDRIRGSSRLAKILDQERNRRGKRKVERKSNWTNEQIIAALREHGTFHAAAKALGCNAQTIRDRLGSDPALLAEFEAAHSELMGLAKQGLRHYLEKKDWRAIKFALETLGRREFTRRTEVQALDEAGNPAPIMAAQMAAPIINIIVDGEPKTSVRT